MKKKKTIPTKNRSKNGFEKFGRSKFNIKIQDFDIDFSKLNSNMESKTEIKSLEIKMVSKNVIDQNLI